MAAAHRRERDRAARRLPARRRDPPRRPAPGGGVPAAAAPRARDPAPDRRRDRARTSCRAPSPGSCSAPSSWPASRTTRASIRRSASPPSSRRSIPRRPPSPRPSIARRDPNPRDLTEAGARLRGRAPRRSTSRSARSTSAPTTSPRRLAEAEQARPDDTEPVRRSTSSCARARPSTSSGSRSIAGATRPGSSRARHRCAHDDPTPRRFAGGSPPIIRRSPALTSNQPPLTAHPEVAPMPIDPLDQQLVEAVLTRPRRAKADLEEAKLAGLRPSRAALDEVDEDRGRGRSTSEPVAARRRRRRRRDRRGRRRGRRGPHLEAARRRPGQARRRGARGAHRGGARGALGRHDRDRRPGPDVPQGDRQGRPADRRGRGRPGQGHRARRAARRRALEGHRLAPRVDDPQHRDQDPNRSSRSTACRSARRPIGSSATRSRRVRRRRPARRRRRTSTSSRAGKDAQSEGTKELLKEARKLLAAYARPSRPIGRTARGPDRKAPARRS